MCTHGLHLALYRLRLIQAAPERILGLNDSQLQLASQRLKNGFLVCWPVFAPRTPRDHWRHTCEFDLSASVEKTRAKGLNGVISA